MIIGAPERQVKAWFKTNLLVNKSNSRSGQNCDETNETRQPTRDNDFHFLKLSKGVF